MPHDTWSRWEALAAAHPAPAWVGQRQPLEEIAPGQVWNAYWKQCELLILLTDGPNATGELGIVPVTVEPGVEAVGSAVIDAAVSPLQVQTVVWTTIPARVSIGVLDRVIGVGAVPNWKSVLRHRWIDGLGIREGHGIPSPQSATADAIGRMGDALDILNEMPRLDTQVAASQQLPIDLRTVIEVLGTSQPRAMLIIQGKEPLTESEAALLANATGIDIDTLVNSAALPLDLQLELLHPKWRPLVRRYARQEAADEIAGRRKLGFDAYALAARETNVEAGRWAERLRSIEQSHPESLA